MFYFALKIKQLQLAIKMYNRVTSIVYGIPYHALHSFCLALISKSFQIEHLLSPSVLIVSLDSVNTAAKRLQLSIISIALIIFVAIYS